MTERDESVVEFMRAVMRALGVTSTTQLQDALIQRGLMRSSQLRNLSRWVAGHTAPSFHATMMLLRTADMLKEPGRAEPLRLGSHEAEVAALAETLEKLAGVARGLLQGEEAPAPPVELRRSEPEEP